MAMFIKGSSLTTSASELVSTFSHLVIDMRDHGTIIKWKDMGFTFKETIKYDPGSGSKGF